MSVLNRLVCSNLKCEKMAAVFTFDSTHNALEGERILQAQGFAVKMMALPASLGHGCGLCLRVPFEDWPKAQEKLTTESVEFKGIYRQSRVGRQTNYEALMSL